MPQRYKNYAKNTYLHLTNIDFLKAFNAYPLKEQWVRIILLDKNDQIKENKDGTFQVITGYATGGSISVNGKSALRRTGSLQLVATEENYRVLDTTNTLSIKTRFAIEIGFTNPGFNENITSDILWFPCGVFVATGASISRNLTSWNISLSFKDKMALLNGELGGKFPASVELHLQDTVVTNEDGSTIIVSKPALVKDIVEKMVINYGKEQINNIIIEDIPSTAQAILRWNGASPLYFIEIPPSEGGKTQYEFSTNITDIQADDGRKFITYVYGDDIGRESTEYTYPAVTLEAKAGESVMQVLEKMIKVMGNYECYYNTFGEFVFKEIDNSLYDTHSEPIPIYTFTNVTDGGLLVSTYNNNPQYTSIKNDFIILGESSGKSIFYHFAFDKNILDEYKDNTKNVSTSIIVYKDDYDRYCWTTQGNGIVMLVQAQNLLEFVYLKTVTLNEADESFEYYEPYKAEIQSFLPDMINLNLSDELRLQAWNNYNIGDGQYWLDLISTNDLLNNAKSLDIADLGRRTEIINNNDINCISAPSTPNFIINPPNDYDPTAHNEIPIYLSTTGSIYKSIGGGGMLNSAKEYLQTTLHNYITYNETISIGIIPIYWLEPNTCIKVEDSKTNIEGFYSINSFSIPLTSNGSMTLSCSKLLQMINPNK